MTARPERVPFRNAWLASAVAVVCALAGVLAGPADAVAATRARSASTTSAGRPATPTGVRVAATSRGTWLTWTATRNTGAVVTVAANAALTLGRHDYRVGNATAQFSPPGLARGHRYWFRVRAVSGTARSAYSALVSAVPAVAQQPVRAMSYNILNLGADGTREHGSVVAPWSQRRGPAAALITSTNPDVIGVQEGNWWADAARHVLQVDSLNDALGGRYALAHTELRYGEPGYAYFRAGGNYILYRRSTYRAVGAGGYWFLGVKAYAVYQELQNTTTGARLLVVNTHLTQPGGHANDLNRQSETRVMVSKATAAGARAGASVVYVGDFNSNANPKAYTLDGPGVVMRGARVADTRAVAVSTVNPLWDSINDYLRAPYHYGLYWDYVMAAPGVATTRVGMALHMSGGRFVGVIPSDHNPVWADLLLPYVPTS